MSRRLQYKSFDVNNGNCIHAVLSDRAYTSIVSEVLSNNQNETGGVFIGNIYNRVWYIVDAIDPGIDTVNQMDFFRWEADYVNHLAARNGRLYRFPLTIVGFWHRHPGSMDYFSMTDENTIRSNLRESRFGLLSMLVNIDPELRMTFYYCGGDSVMKIRYDHGDEYFPRELLEYATPEMLAKRVGTRYAMGVKILPNRVLRPEQLPRSVFPDSARSQAVPPREAQPAAREDRTDRMPSRREDPADHMPAAREDRTGRMPAAREDPAGRMISDRERAVQKVVSLAVEEILERRHESGDDSFADLMRAPREAAHLLSSLFVTRLCGDSAKEEPESDWSRRVAEGGEFRDREREQPKLWAPEKPVEMAVTKPEGKAAAVLEEFPEEGSEEAGTEQKTWVPEEPEKEAAAISEEKAAAVLEEFPEEGLEEAGTEQKTWVPEEPEKEAAVISEEKAAAVLEEFPEEGSEEAGAEQKTWVPEEPEEEAAAASEETQDPAWGTGMEE